MRNEKERGREKEGEEERGKRERKGADREMVERKARRAALMTRHSENRWTVES